jgi:hypothetical protein
MHDREQIFPYNCVGRLIVFMLTETGQPEIRLCSVSLIRCRAGRLCVLCSAHMLEPFNRLSSYIFLHMLGWLCIRLLRKLPQPGMDYAVSPAYLTDGSEDKRTAHDVAMLHFPELPPHVELPGLTVAAIQPTLYQACTILGFPARGDEIWQSRGHLLPELEGGGAFVSATRVETGSSGGPWLNSNNQVLRYSQGPPGTPAKQKG